MSTRGCTTLLLCCKELMLLLSSLPYNLFLLSLLYEECVCLWVCVCSYLMEFFWWWFYICISVRNCNMNRKSQRSVECRFFLFLHPHIFSTVQGICMFYILYFNIPFIWNIQSHKTFLHALNVSDKREKKTLSKRRRCFSVLQCFAVKYVCVVTPQLCVFFWQQGFRSYIMTPTNTPDKKN